MQTRLDPTGKSTAIGNRGLVLRTPGLEGFAEIVPDHEDGTRGSQQSDAMTEALQSAGFHALHQIAIGRTREVPGGPSAGMRSASGRPAVVLEVPKSGSDWAQLVLAVDESGGATWVFADRCESDAEKDVFAIPRPVPPTPAELGPEGATRGLFGAIGKKIIKVLAFKAAGAAVAWGIDRWESANRPPRWRSVRPDTLGAEVDERFGPEDSAFWTRMAAGRALLFVHGTFSQTHQAFGELPIDTVESLSEAYGGRLFAFDHPTVGTDLAGNLEAALARLPQETRLEIDIVGHSRGGLVARTLATSPRFDVRRLVCVGTPNRGTVLTDPEHMGTFIDLYTTWLNFLPDNGVSDTLEVILEVVKEVALEGLGRLEGLQVMNPGSDVLRALNGGPVPRYEAYAIAANFEAGRPPGFADWVKDRVMDSVFVEENDLVVPTLGVYSGVGSGFPDIPEARRLLLDLDAEVDHGSYFEHPRVSAQLREWLRGS